MNNEPKYIYLTKGEIEEGIKIFNSVKRDLQNLKLKNKYNIELIKDANKGLMYCDKLLQKFYK